MSKRIFMLEEQNNFVATMIKYFQRKKLVSLNDPTHICRNQLDEFCAKQNLPTKNC